VTGPPVRVAIDVRRAVYAGHTGIGRYVAELASGLELRPEVRVTRLSSSRATFRSPVRKALWDQIGVLAASAQAELFHAPYYETSPLAGRRLVVNVHDLDTVEAPERYSRRSRAYLNGLLGLLVRRASRIIVPSQHTHDRLEALYGVGEKSDVIPYGVDASFAAPPSASIVDPPFVVYTGGYAHRKDVPALLAVFAALVDDGYKGKLVLTGGPWPESDVLERLPPAATARVNFTGRVGDGDLAGLYAAADLLLYPSLMEGFGFPIIEAMAAGCPVVSTTAGSVPELAGTAAILTAPRDTDSLLAGAQRVLSDGAVRAQMVRAGREQSRAFTWDRTVAATIESYRAALGRA
jgi:glycosyltransferase involved in cell wall biosynthesis